MHSDQELASIQHFFPPTAMAPCGLSRSRGQRSRVGVSRQFFFVQGWVCVRFKKAKGGSLAVEKEVPDAEGLFIGNFECVSMSGEVMRTAANTNSNCTHNFLWHRLNRSQSLTHGSGCTTLFLGSVVIVLFIFRCNQSISVGLNDRRFICKPRPPVLGLFYSGVPFLLSECQGSSWSGVRNICIMRSFPVLVQFSHLLQTGQLTFCLSRMTFGTLLALLWPI